MERFRNFICLHLCEDNSVIVTNTDAIVLISSVNYDNVCNDTTVYNYEDSEIENYTIHESVNKVYQLLCEQGNNKYILVHDSDDNSVVCINTYYIDHVMYINRNNKKVTQILLSENSTSICVNESVEKIYQALRNISIDNM